MYTRRSQALGNRINVANTAIMGLHILATKRDKKELVKQLTTAREQLESPMKQITIQTENRAFTVEETLMRVRTVEDSVLLALQMIAQAGGTQKNVLPLKIT